MLPMVFAAEKTATEKTSTRNEIAALSWEGSKLQLFLYAPNGTMISPKINNSMIKHVMGSNYDYYLLNNAPFGNWTLKVVPVQVPTKGENITLVTGQITAQMLPNAAGKK